MKSLLRKMLLLVVSVFSGSHVSASDRVALVVGIANYQNLPNLTAVANDGTDLRSRLTKMGFTVSGGDDLPLASLRSEVAKFKRIAWSADVALFYFFGYDVECKGSNLLVPADIDPESIGSGVSDACISLSEVMDTIGGGPLLRMFVLNCSRSKLCDSDFQVATSGLTVPNKSRKRMILLHSAADALSPEERNSALVHSLLTQMDVPEVRVDEMFSRVVNDIVLKSKGLHRPLFINEYSGGFMFVPPQQAPQTHFTNSLGMMFSSLPGTSTLMCIHETRKKDYLAFAKENPGLEDSWRWHVFKDGSMQKSDDHPAINITFHSAQAFCKWLSNKEGHQYRLPTDREWSVAVGLGARELDDGQYPIVSWRGFPWGYDFPPSGKAGNYGVTKDDGFDYTAPVMSYTPNRYGYYDLGGNVAEWVTHSYKAGRHSQQMLERSRMLRGASWFNVDEMDLISTARNLDRPDITHSQYGFRCVLEAEQ